MKSIKLFGAIVFALFSIFAAQDRAVADDMKKGAKTDTQAKSTAAPVGVTRVSDITGATVKNYQGEQLGEVEDLVIGRDGRIQYMVLSHGGFLDIGDRLFAIPWEAVKESTQENAFLLPVDRERLANAPNFERNKWPNFNDPDVAVIFYGYYMAEPGKAKQQGERQQAPGSGKSDEDKTRQRMPQ